MVASRTWEIFPPRWSSKANEDILLQEEDLTSSRQPNSKLYYNFQPEVKVEQLQEDHSDISTGIRRPGPILTYPEMHLWAFTSQRTSGRLGKKNSRKTNSKAEKDIRRNEMT